MNTVAVVAVLRTNSGTFSTEQTIDLLSGFLKRSASVTATDSIAQQWKFPTRGIRVHVTVVGDIIEVVDYFGTTLSGIGAINDALSIVQKNSVVL